MQKYASLIKVLFWINSWFVIVKVLFVVLLIIDYSTKWSVLVYSRKCASEIVYYNFHVSLGDKTEKRYDLFCA